MGNPEHRGAVRKRLGQGQAGDREGEDWAAARGRPEGYAEDEEVPDEGVQAPHSSAHGPDELLETL